MDCTALSRWGLAASITSPSTNTQPENSQHKVMVVAARPRTQQSCDRGRQFVATLSTFLFLSVRRGSAKHSIERASGRERDREISREIERDIRIHAMMRSKPKLGRYQGDRGRGLVHSGPGSGAIGAEIRHNSGRDLARSGPRSGTIGAEIWRDRGRGQISAPIAPNLGPYRARFRPLSRQISASSAPHFGPHRARFRPLSCQTRPPKRQS
jgi:hypothetical protein